MEEKAAGLYIHVPFCQRKCAYCDFYSRAEKQLIAPYIAALCQEIAESSNYLDAAAPYYIATIYFGGGTPSQLSAEHFQKIFDCLAQHYDLSRVEEITLEANPDDLSADYLQSLKSLPFNRLSIGIQSFNNQELTFIHRRHDAQTAIRAVKEARKAGFNNISIDLMFGLPLQTMESFAESIQQAIALKAEHISAYMLGLEPDVPLAKSLEAGLWQACDDETAADMYQYLSEQLQAAGYEHYEISNFALPGRRSRHNSSYWKGLPYVGLGPSAHAYNLIGRRWNASNLHTYIKGNFVREEEILSDEDNYNDYLLTRLRTREGIAKHDFIARFGQEKWQHLQQETTLFIEQKQLISTGTQLQIAPSAYFVSDNIIRELLEV